MGENDIVDVLSDFDDGFVFGVDRINTDSMEDDAVFCKDGFGDATGDFVDIGDCEGVGDFDMNGG